MRHIVSNGTLFAVVKEVGRFLPFFKPKVGLTDFPVNVAQHGVCLREIGVYVHRLPQLFDGSFVLPGTSQSLSEIRVVLEVQGIELNGSPQMRNGLRVARLAGTETA